MKGIVFTEFLEMVEDQFGYETVEHVIENSGLTHDAMYVAGGSYPHQEMVSMVTALHKKLDMPVSTLLEEFGKYLFHRLIALYPQFTEGKATPIDFIASVHDIIHVEVKKLYPDAELPTFTTVSKSGNELVLDYSSPRKMESLAVGLMQGCAEHYRIPIQIEMKPLEGSEGNKTTTRFTIKA